MLDRRRSENWRTPVQWSVCCPSLPPTGARDVGTWRLLSMVVVDMHTQFWCCCFCFSSCCTRDIAAVPSIRGLSMLMSKVAVSSRTCPLAFSTRNFGANLCFVSCFALTILVQLSSQLDFDGQMLIFVKTGSRHRLCLIVFGCPVNTDSSSCCGIFPLFLSLRTRTSALSGCPSASDIEFLGCAVVRH